MRYFISIRDEVLEVEVEGDEVRVDGEVVDARLLPEDGSGLRALRLGHRSHAVVPGERNGDTRVLHVDGKRFRMDVVDERTRRVRAMSAGSAGAAGPRPLKAPMPGLVVKVEVEPGQEVEQGQGLVIVEAMKMENELRAEADAVVGRILVEPGQAVEKDQVLLDFAAPEAESREQGAEG
jgi:pyruvate carboxylase subunit B